MATNVRCSRDQLHDTHSESSLKTPGWSRARGELALDGRRTIAQPVLAALVILPARRHPVQTFTRFGEPLISARTRWIFGFQRRFVRTWEWLTLMPNDGFLPQTSQTDAMSKSFVVVAPKWGQ